MGEARTARCNACSHEFEIARGPGMFCHLLHCDGCYAVRFVGFEEIADLLGELEDAGGDAYEADTRGDDAPASPVERAYDLSVEAFAGWCACGGHFRFAATPCCPGCRARSIEVGEAVLRFD